LEYYTLDACAIVAMLWKEPGSDILGDIFKRATKNEAVLIMHLVNLVEVYSVVHKKEGTASADMAIERIKQSPIQFFDTMGQPFVSTFAQVKVHYGTHFTDTFVVATNIIHAINGTILTADHGFDKIKDEGKINVTYFR